MFDNKNAYNNVIAFPTGKPFVSTEYLTLQQNVKNFNHYLVHVEEMVRNLKWKKPILANNNIKNIKKDTPEN